MTKLFGLHETLEVHEILTFKSLCLTKSSTMSGLVGDVELKNILLNDVNTGSKHVEDLQEFIKNGWGK
jgi:similar to spore coat protein